MKVERKVVTVRTERTVDLIDVTDMIEQWLKEINAKRGIINIFVPHTTAGILINENEIGLVEDIKGLMERIAPVKREYRHNRIDHNAHAHLRSVLLGTTMNLHVEGGKLLLGTWQRVFLYEGDGPRNRRLVLTYIGL